MAFAPSALRALVPLLLVPQLAPLVSLAMRRQAVLTRALLATPGFGQMATCRVVALVLLAHTLTTAPWRDVICVNQDTHQ